MIGAALVNVMMWIGAIFLESKYSLALVIATLIVTIIGATLTIWNSDESSSGSSTIGGQGTRSGSALRTSKVNEPLPDPMDFDIEMPLS